MKRKMASNLILGLVCITCTLYGCSFNEPEVELHQHCSNKLNYEELVQYVADLYKIGIAEGISQEKNEHTYRILYTPIKDGKEIYEAGFLVETKETNSDWEIINIKYGWVKDAADSEVRFLGALALWPRDTKGIEYSINGDLCKVSEVELKIDEEKKNKGIMIYSSTETEVKNNRYIFFHDTVYF
ncbi:MAG: hypothetical protein HFE73_04225 [Firmicutes bacterium]|nr:hypothetical protein [Bacillota bacterium]